MNAVWDVLVYVVLPLWVLCGFLDYLCHRSSDLEHTGGTRELLLHWLMIAEVALPLILAVFFQINVFEHQVHSALEILPLAAIFLVMILHWPQTGALFGFGAATADFALAWKPPPALGELLPPALAFVVFALAPYAEEYWRCARRA